MAFDPWNPFPDFNRPAIQQQRATNAMPVRPPNGETPISGDWQQRGGSWVWIRRNGSIYTGQQANPAVGATGTAPGTPDAINSQYTQWANGQNSNAALAANQQGKNPFGNDYNTNLSYTPFGLGDRNNMMGGSAFGGPPQGARGSDQLTPNLEQIRMQYMQQLYAPYLSGGR